ncbi:MAG: DUF456 domain-containing protein [Verrucomicrobiota bacterium]|jgi:hypothetical protein|nr:DUF456 domain-containing protein [Verrucomicrobiota bacterium]
MLEIWIGFGLILLVMFIGMIGNLIPGVPGTSLIFTAGLIHQLYFGDNGGIGWFWIFVLGILMSASFLIDYIASLLGAKTLGATWRGMLGAFVGIILGLILLPPFGLIIGPFIGAIVFEWAFGRELREASKAGIGAVVGVLLGMVGSAICGMAMLGIFLFAAFPYDNTETVSPEIEIQQNNTLEQKPDTNPIPNKSNIENNESVELNN